MFTRVLAPVDMRPAANVSVTLAEQIASRTRAELILMRVMDAATSPSDAAAQRESLERLAAEIAMRGSVTPRIEVVTGRPETRILETAERERVDLIALAPHMRGGLDALRHHSVTSRLMAHTTAPLLIVPEHSGGARPADLLNASTSLVIVPVDGSALSERAISVGQRIAESWGRPLLLLRVIEPLSMYVAGPETIRLERNLNEEEAQQAHRELSSLRARVARQTDLAIEAMVKQGAADRIIAQAADQYPGSLIVMSTHGRNPALRAMLGSVTLSVLRRAHEPTLIVPPLAALRFAAPQKVAAAPAAR